MSNEKEARDILLEFERLQAQQAELVARLAHLNLGRADRAVLIQPPRQASPEPEPHRFRVGDQVRIKNPNWGQPQEGQVVKVGPRFVTVRSPRGAKVRREPHNLESI